MLLFVVDKVGTTIYQKKYQQLRESSHIFFYETYLDGLVLIFFFVENSLFYSLLKIFYK